MEKEKNNQTMNLWLKKSKEINVEKTTKTTPNQNLNCLQSHSVTKQ